MEDWKKDPVIRFVIDQARSTGRIKRVWLFGSRAKGVATEKSDYDLAFLMEDSIAGSSNGGSWGVFATSLREGNPRLNSMDLVVFDEIGEELQERILQEGIVIYDKG